MVQGFEKRTCHRFEIPGSSLMYKKIGIFREKKYVDAIRLYNISKGGLSFACEEEFKIGKSVIIKIIIPNDKPLELLSKICWQRESSDKYSLATGVSYMVFGEGPNRNPIEALNMLRKLDEQYVKVR